MNISRLIKRTRSFARRWCAPLTALAYAPPLFAQTEVAKTRVDPMSAEYVVKTAVGMIVEIGIIVALAWLVRRMGKISGHMKGEEKLQLGATPQQINRIARIKSPVDAGAAAAPAERLTFQQLFAKLKHGPRA